MHHWLRCAALAAPTALYLFLLAAGTGHAYPGSVYTTSGPVRGPSVATTTEVTEGTYAVASRTGAAAYRFDVAMPPGRLGMQPSVALTYSSQNPLRGGLAAGWTLDVPSIRVDTSQGRLTGLRYASSLAGGQTLVAVDEPSAPGGVVPYRAEHDASYARYEFVPLAGTSGMWRVLEPSGRTHYFGETPASRDEPGPHDAGDRARWFLTRSVDRHGNTVRYFYQPVEGAAMNGRLGGLEVDIRLSRIEYTSNANAGIGPHAKILFEYHAIETCPGSHVPVGARFDFGSGIRLYEGASRLRRIAVEVDDDGWQRRREVDLGYDEEALGYSGGTLTCATEHAPMRLLTSITERAWNRDGELVERAPITFEYGRAARRFTEQVGVDGLDGSLGHGLRRLNPYKAGGWPTVDLEYSDVDGDGRLDRLRSLDDVTCDIEVEHNLGDGSFAAPDPAAMWSMPWQEDGIPGPSDGANSIYMKEGCNLAYQLSRRKNRWECNAPASSYVSYRRMDLDGDGLAEIVTAIDSKVGGYNPIDDPMLDTAYPVCIDNAPCEVGGGSRDMCVTRPDMKLSPWFFAPPTGPTYPVPDSCGSTDGGDPACVPPHCSPMNALDPNVIDECACDPTWCGDDWAFKIGSYYDPPENDPDTSQGPGMLWHGRGFETGDMINEDADGGGAGTTLACSFRPERNCGHYVWRVQWNHGNGNYSPPELIHSPTPLESDRGTSGIGGVEGPASSWHAYTDIDGDGNLDAVWQHPKTIVPDWDGDLQVFRGDGHGHFHGPYRWSVPPVEDRVRLSLNRNGYLTGRTTNGNFHRYSERVVSLRDINGDGLPDLVMSLPADTAEESLPSAEGRTVPLRVYYNHGAGFESTAVARYGTVLTDDFHTIAREERVVLTENPVTRETDAGWSVHTQRDVDVDEDGLVDVVALPSPSDGATDPWEVSGAATPYFNVGDRLVPGNGAGLAPIRTALQRIHVTDDERWELKTDVVDVDGDGRLDAFTNPEGPCFRLNQRDYTAGMWATCGTSSYVEMDPADRGHLLQTIDNGRGATISFAYAPSSDPSVVVANTAAGERNPRAMWVVASMTVDPGVDPAGTTSYAYRGPVVKRDERGRFGFRGFREAAITGPANAAGERKTTIERYAYGVDPTGRLRETVVVQGSDDVATIERRTHARFELFGGAVTTYHEVDRRTWTCSASHNKAGLAANESACRQNGAMRRVTSSWRAMYVAGDSGEIDGSLSSEPSLESSTLSDPVVDQPDAELPDDGSAEDDGGVVDQPPLGPPADEPDACTQGTQPVYGSVPVLWVECGQRITESHTSVVLEGDRRLAWDHDLYAETDVFQLLPIRSHRWIATSGSSSGWGSLTRIGKTRTFYDAARRGLPVESRVLQGPGVRARTKRGFDPDTGVVRWVQKPRQVASGSGLKEQRLYDPFQLYAHVVFNEAGHVIQQERDPATGLVTRSAVIQHEGAPWEETVYDGFGRVTSRWRWRAPDGGGDDEPFLHQRIAYCDDTVPGRVRTTTLLDYAPSDWIGDGCTGTPGGGVVTRDRQLDGFGRVVRETAWNPGGPATTRYDRDAAGNVVTMTAPNPANDGSSSVTYRWYHDALGRVVAATPPEGASTVFAYDGLTELRSHADVDPGDPAMPVTTRHDVHGRLVEVIESGPDGPATTTYAYDGNDHMSLIVDADGMATEMDHDWTGNRTRVRVQNTEWHYHYDLEGNLVRTDYPRPAGAAPPPDAPGTADQSFWFEAEWGEITAPMLALPSWLASGGGYVSVFNGGGNALEPGSGGSASYTFHVQRPGEFRIWGLAGGFSDEDDSFFVQVDNGEMWLWEIPVISFAPMWDLVSDAGGADPATVWLDVGAHTVRVWHREDGAILDKLLITEDTAYTPSGWEDSAPLYPGADALAYSTLLAYDAVGRVTTRWSGTRDLTPEQITRYGLGTVTYEYDDPAHSYSVGRQTSVVRPTGRTKRHYTSEGWLAEEQIAFTVNPYGNWTFHDQRTRRLAYGAQGQVIRAEHADGNGGFAGTVTTATYDATGQPDAAYIEVGTDPQAVALASIRRGRTGLPLDRVSGGWPHDWDYDRLGRVVDHTISGPGGAVAGETLVYDSVGNVRSVTSKATRQTITYTYDEQHQLRTATADDPALYTAYFEYSPAGKVRFMDVVVTPDSPNAGSRAGDVAHGAMGAVASIGDTTSPAGEHYAAEHDERGAVRERTIDGSGAGHFHYDGDGQLREVTDTDVREVYYYDGPRRMLAFADAGQTLRGRLFFGDAEVHYQPGSVAKTELHVSLGAQPIARLTNGGLDPDYTFHGVLGSLLAVYDADTALARYAYGPYGEILWQQQAEPGDFTRLYNDKEHDPSGLVYYGFRYYDTTTLSWTQADPMYRVAPDLAYDEPRRASLFTFNLNNPLRYVDPDGRDGKEEEEEMEFPPDVVYDRANGGRLDEDGDPLFEPDTLDEYERDTSGHGNRPTKEPEEAIYDSSKMLYSYGLRILFHVAEGRHWDHVAKSAAEYNLMTPRPGALVRSLGPTGTLGIGLKIGNKAVTWVALPLSVYNLKESVEAGDVGESVVSAGDVGTALYGLAGGTYALPAAIIWGNVHVGKELIESGYWEKDFGDYDPLF